MRINRLVLGFALLSCTTAAAVAQSRETTLAEPQAAGDRAALAAARSGWPALFETAYARYPQLPRGVLESIAYVQSRWVMLDGTRAPDAESAPAVGLMGLYQGDGFADQIGDAAALLGVGRAQVERDPRWNILGAAALLADAKRRLPPDASDADLLKAYAGFAAKSHGAIDAFARESFAYDVLLTLDRGVDDGGIRVEARAVEWERQFAPAALLRQRAPFVRLDLSEGSVETDGYAIDARDETLHASRAGVADEVDSGNSINSTDYAPALWVASPYYHARSGATTAVAIHTMQGSYAGSISWFQSNPSSVSAHYLIRSSDGQVTQMVREAQAAHHIGSENSYTLGIEHEGYVDNAAWYTTAMYNASAALTRHFCTRYAIPCASAYNGAAGSGINVLPASVKIKGHQHYPGQTHTDPGINWDWRRYYTLLNPGSGGGTPRTLDGFESGEGHFDTTPAYSGSTTGIGAGSTAERDCSVARVGSCSEHLQLVDNPSNTQPWAVRFLSGSGTPSANTSVARDGKLGFWVYVAGSGFSVGLGVDDSDGTERSTLRAVPADTWTWVEWNLADAAVWNAWVGGNGAITAANVTLDAIWLERAHTAYTVNVYLDEVRWTPN